MEAQAQNPWAWDDGDSDEDAYTPLFRALPLYAPVRCPFLALAVLLFDFYVSFLVNKSYN